MTSEVPRRRLWAAIFSPQEVYSVGEMRRLIVVTKLHWTLLCVGCVGAWTLVGLVWYYGHRISGALEALVVLERLR